MQERDEREEKRPNSSAGVVADMRISVPIVAAPREWEIKMDQYLPGIPSFPLTDTCLLMLVGCDNMDRSGRTFVLASSGR
jgi:hypothetical protein